ncbi:MAG: hypothetical protein IT303_01180 [Dehalococcoidia bacterium]|nr:hypothetical protein [Dehalococcoidia bacterium]
MRADTNDVAFRLLLSLGELWEGLQNANIDPTCKGLHLTKEYLGGYTRYSAGPSTRPRLVVEWNESSRHLRVLRCEEWAGVEATISGTVAYVRAEARLKGLIDVVDATFVGACGEQLPARRTVCKASVPVGASASR